MRKDAKTKTTTLTQSAHIQGYHQGNYSGEDYAFNGYAKNYYYTSDRYETLEVTNSGLKRPNGQDPKGYGLEIEMESYINMESALAEIMEKIVFAHFPKHLFKMQHDGSLNGNTSVECITQVMTKEFIRNHYIEFKAMFDFLKGIRTLPGDSCGMHCNISASLFGKDIETQERNIMKLHNFINKSQSNFKFACGLLNRDPSHTDYCGRMTPNTLDRCGSHYYSMNYKHLSVGRVEIRLVGPQKTFGNFRNTMEVIFHLVAKTKELSAKDWDDPTKLWSGANRYVIDRLETIHAPFTTAQWQKIRENMSTDEYI